MTTSTDPGTRAAYAVPKPRAAAGRPFIVLLLLAFAVGAWFLWRFWFAAEDPGSHQLIEQARTADIERTVTATGILQPRDYVDVGTQVSGQLRKIHVDIGAQVQAGELLAEIDPTVYRSRVDASRAQLANLKAQLAERHARLTLAEQQYARQRGLMLEDATTAEQLQTAEAELHITRAQIAALEAQVEQTESSLRGDEANLGYT
ncbi:MAG: biotin/lipoyl-binding protein, partial [Thiohalobacteraceae bacterium]